MVEVSNYGVTPGEDQRLMPGVRPPNQVRRTTIRSSDLEDLGVAHAPFS